MKIFIRILVGCLVALALGVSAIAIYAWNQYLKEVGKARTAAATNARWAKPRRSDDDDEFQQQEQPQPPRKIKREKVEVEQPKDPEPEKVTAHVSDQFFKEPLTDKPNE